MATREEERAMRKKWQNLTNEVIKEAGGEKGRRNNRKIWTLG